MSLDPRLQQFKNKMELSVDAFTRELSGIRAGRATSALLEPIKVNAYGSLMPINQIGTVSSPDSRLLIVNVWDKDLVKNVERAIRDCEASLNPITEGQVIRVPIPPLSDERRQELSKLAGKYAEDTKVAIRNIRRDAMDHVKAMEKNDEIGEDEMKKLSDDVQDLTNEFSKKIEALLQVKQHDITQI
ncbi:MAG: ribosome recycling factor [Holosporales bacterium]|jgi:ribosome recycling factor|nr:ribosome recycling factor [Holosporales bacterium]